MLKNFTRKLAITAVGLSGLLGPGKVSKEFLADALDTGEEYLAIDFNTGKPLERISRAPRSNTTFFTRYHADGHEEHFRLTSVKDANGKWSDTRTPSEPYQPKPESKPY